MKKIFILFVLGVIASTNVFAAPINSGELFATYQKQGDTFYKGGGEADLTAGSFEWAVNYYIVSCGDSVLLRATTTEDKNLENGWPTQLRIWENAYNNGNEVQVDAGDNKNRYTSSCRRITPSASDLKIHLFLSWEGYCTTQTFAYNRSSINNPIEDAVAPSINPEEVTMEEVGDKLVFTFGAATADDAYFYYVGDKEHNLGGISLTNKVYITKPTIKDGTTYSFKCYAVDYNGNKSDYKEFTLSMDFDPSLNLALNKPCTGGFCQFGGTPEEDAKQYVKANDGNTTNSSYSAFGAPSTDDAWWQVDLGMAYDVTQVKVFWANDYSNGFNIYGSLNGTDWVLIGTDAAKAAKDVTETAVTASTRYIKIHSYNKKNIVMYEVEVYGTGFSVADATKPTVSVACTDKTVTSATLQINAADTDDNGNAGIVTSIKVSDIANEFAEVEVISLLDGDNKITLDGLKDNTTYNFNIIVTDRAGNTTTETIEVVLPFNTNLNLALNKPCTGGFCQFGGTPEEDAKQYVKANDGNTTNSSYSAFGAPSTDDAWWQVDLGMAYDVTQVKVFWANDYSNGFNIYGSLNGTDWVLIGTDAAKAAKDVTETAVTASTRYIKIHSYNKKNIVMYEVEVYGTGFSVADATKPTVSVACTDKTVTSATLQINAADTDDNGNAGIVTSIKVSDIANEFAEVEVISLLDGDNKITLDGLKDNTTYNFNIIVTDRAGNTTTEAIEVVLPFNTNLNLALGGTATDGYHEGDGTAADKAIDGNADTKWNTYGVQNDDVDDGYIGDYANNWMSIDLGAAYDLSNIKLSFVWVWNNVITEYLIEGSLDGSNWYILAHITDQATDAADLIIDASAQYVRFRAITEEALGIKEFEVYGTGFYTMTDALPIITFAQVGTITDNSAEIEISAADITTSPITQYVVTGADEAAIELTATDNKIVITGLAQSTTYAIQIQAKDNDGNLSAPQQLTFTTIGSVSGLYMYSGYFGWGEKTQERARFSNTAVEGVMVLTINNMTVGNHNFKLYNATDDRCTMGDCGGVSDHYIANQEVQTVTFYATSEDRFISSVDSLYLRGSLVGEDQALVWNEDHTVATWTGTLDLTGNKQFTIIKKCQVGATPHTYARDFYTEEQTFDGDYNYGTFTLDLTTMTGTWGYVGLSFEDYATSNNTIIAEHDGHKANVAINRTIKATGEWFTLCLPFDMDEDKVFEVFGNSTIATLVSSEDRGSIIHLNFDYVKAIEAGKAYMIKPGKDFVAGSIIEGVTIKNVNPEDLKSTCDHMYFQGVFDQYLLEGDNKRFVSANNYLYSPAEGGTTMGAFRCYFTIPVESQALVGSKAARIVFGPQVATGTENVQSDQVPSAKVIIDGTLYIIREGRTYNAQGQLVK